MIRASEQGRPDVRAARQVWAADVLPNTDPSRVVLVDETAASTKFDRPCAYAPRWGSVIGRVPHGHYKSRTFTAALRADGPTGRPPARCSTGR